jgi:hypothetical protein
MIENLKSSNLSNLDYSAPELYYKYIITLAILFIIIQILNYLWNHKGKIKNLNVNPTKTITIIDTSEINHQLNLLIKKKRLKIIYILAFLFSKGAMWAKAPYTYLLFSTYHNFKIHEIGFLYMIEAFLSLIFSPFLGLIADSFGRKKVSLLYPFNTILLLTFRMTGNISLAYVAQIISGITSGILATTFESWLNYEIVILFSHHNNDNMQNTDSCYNFCIYNYANEIEKFRKKIFSAVIFYDSIISMIVTLTTAVVFVSKYLV